MAEQPNELPFENAGRAAEPVAGNTQDTVIIRAEIEETRAQMGDTLDEIGERLRPSHIKQQIGQSVRDATVGRVEDAARNAADRVSGAGQRFVDVVRDNPIPVAMVGIGLGWLFWGARRSSSGELPSGTSPSQSQGRVSEVAENVTDRAKDVARTVKHDAREGARLASDQFYGNPLAAGLAAVAIGVAAGLAIPETRAERELMGAARDKLVDRAKDVASEAKEKLQTVAERTLDEAKAVATDAAREQGLTH